MNTANNIFKLPASLTSEEYFEKLVEQESFFIERIISEGHVTPEGEWYDQETNEFVMLIKGSAEIEFGNSDKIEMNPGDYINIPKHVKHRVNRTDEKGKTFWLAVHYN